MSLFGYLLKSLIFFFNEINTLRKTAGDYLSASMTLFFHFFFFTAHAHDDPSCISVEPKSRSDALAPLTCTSRCAFMQRHRVTPPPANPRRALTQEPVCRGHAPRPIRAVFPESAYTRRTWLRLRCACERGR